MIQETGVSLMVMTPDFGHQQCINTASILTGIPQPSYTLWQVQAFPAPLKTSTELTHAGSCALRDGMSWMCQQLGLYLTGCDC
jgi:hypothetical protein